MKRSLLCALAGLSLAHGSAGADTLTVARSFSGGSFDAIGVAPFDPALGTLDSVQVRIDGVLSASGVTAPFLVEVAPGLFAPQPHAFEVRVEQTFFGLLDKYFEFETPAQFTLPGLASGGGESFSLQTQFSWDFRFNEGSDLLGFAVPSFSSSYGSLVPPTSISGTRAGFLPGFVPIDEVDLAQSWLALGISGPAPTISSVLAQGSLFIHYHYTPMPIPEPHTYALLLAGLLLLAVRARQRRRRIAP